MQKLEKVQTLDFNSHKLVGKSIQLFPNDTNDKYGKIEEINHSGYFIRITSSQRNEYRVNELLFFNHSTPLHFIILD